MATSPTKLISPLDDNDDKEFPLTIGDTHSRGYLLRFGHRFSFGRQTEKETRAVQIEEEAKAVQEIEEEILNLNRDSPNDQDEIEVIYGDLDLGSKDPCIDESVHSQESPSQDTCKNITVNTEANIDHADFRSRSPPRSDLPSPSSPREKLIQLPESAPNTLCIQVPEDRVDDTEIEEEMLNLHGNDPDGLDDGDLSLGSRGKCIDESVHSHESPSPDVNKYITKNTETDIDHADPQSDLLSRSPPRSDLPSPSTPSEEVNQLPETTPNTPCIPEERADDTEMEIEEEMLNLHGNSPDGQDEIEIIYGDLDLGSKDPCIDESVHSRESPSHDINKNTTVNTEPDADHDHVDRQSDLRSRSLPPYQLPESAPSTLCIPEERADDPEIEIEEEMLNLHGNSPDGHDEIEVVFGDSDLSSGELCIDESVNSHGSPSHNTDINNEIGVDVDHADRQSDLSSRSPPRSDLPSPSSPCEELNQIPETAPNTLCIQIPENREDDTETVPTNTTSPGHILQSTSNPVPVNSNNEAINSQSGIPNPTGISQDPEVSGNPNATAAAATLNNMGMGGMVNMAAFQNPLFQFSTFMAAAMQTMGGMGVGMNPMMNFAGFPISNSGNPAQTPVPMPNESNTQMQMATMATFFQQMMTNFANQQFMNTQQFRNPLVSPQTLPNGQPLISPSLGPQPAQNGQPLISPGLGTQPAQNGQPLISPSLGPQPTQNSQPLISPGLGTQPTQNGQPLISPGLGTQPTQNGQPLISPGLGPQPAQNGQPLISSGLGTQPKPTQYGQPLISAGFCPQPTQNGQPLISPGLGPQPTQNGQPLISPGLGPQSTQNGKPLISPGLGPQPTQNGQPLISAGLGPQPTQNGKPLISPGLGPQPTQNCQPLILPSLGPQPAQNGQSLANVSPEIATIQQIAAASPQFEPIIRIRTDILENGQDQDLESELNNTVIVHDSRVCGINSQSVETNPEDTPKRKISLESYYSTRKKSKDVIPRQEVQATASAKSSPDKNTWMTYAEVANEAQLIPVSLPIPIVENPIVLDPRIRKTPPNFSAEIEKQDMKVRVENYVKLTASDFFKGNEDWESEVDNTKQTGIVVVQDIKPDVSWEPEDRPDSVGRYSRSGSLGEYKSGQEMDRQSIGSGSDSRYRPASFRDTDRHSSTGSDRRVRSNPSRDIEFDQDTRSGSSGGYRSNSNNPRYFVVRNKSFERERSRSRSPQRRSVQNRSPSPGPQRSRQNRSRREDNSPDSSTFKYNNRGHFKRGRGYQHDRAGHTSGVNRYDSRKSSPDTKRNKYDRQDQDQHTGRNKFDRSGGHKVDRRGHDAGKYKFDRSSNESGKYKKDRSTNETGKYRNDRSGNDSGKHKYERPAQKFKPHGSNRGRGQVHGRAESPKYHNTDAENWEEDAPVVTAKRSSSPARKRSNPVESRNGSNRKRPGSNDDEERVSRRPRADLRDKLDAKRRRCENPVTVRPKTPPEPAYIPEPGTENYFNSKFEDWDGEADADTHTNNPERDNGRGQEPDGFRIRIPPPPTARHVAAVPITQVVYVTRDQPMTRDYPYKNGRPGQDIYELPVSDSIPKVRCRQVEYVTTSGQSIAIHHPNSYMTQNEPIVYDYRHGNNAPLLLSGGNKFDADSGYHLVKPGRGSGNSVSVLEDPRFEDWEKDD